MTDTVTNPIRSLSSSLQVVDTNTPVSATTTAESLFSTQLASALATISDSQYFQDSISPATIRSQLTQQSLDPSNSSSTPTLLKAMKWLLASVSKGRNVSDFFPHVVKLVTSPSLEVRKMVYMYLVHYADHDSTCRELALLSINSFQRGLVDSEQWIRALALRVLTSIRVMDVVQIQIMAVKKCSGDKSPYVRKCAATALSKLYPRVTGDGHSEETGRSLLEMLEIMLENEQSTMVLSSVLMSFSEMCPESLNLLHEPYRKLCHLLTDMDEWGQIMVMDILTRYCRKFFKKPDASDGGSAEVIDRERRIVRRITDKGIIISSSSNSSDNLTQLKQDSALPTSLPKDTHKKKRFVRKAFYSDEDDESSEENFASLTPRISSPNSSLASTVRQRDIFGFRQGIKGADNDKGGVIGRGSSLIDATGVVDQDQDLEEDHRLLLRSSLPLLKSRNAGVVLGVCSLHYYCGVASIKIRSALGKALVRIYRDRREIQYIVLSSIKILVWECPSAFIPFLNDFFVKAMDPSFTRLIKLDILTALALEPNSINAVLTELRTYIRHDDKAFVCASIQAVSKIAEMAKVVFGRLERLKPNSMSDANVILLNCLHGLLTLSESSDYAVVVAECVGAMQRILLLLLSNEIQITTNGGADTSNHGIGGYGGELSSLRNNVEDPNHVQSMALRRLVILLIRSLSSQKDGNNGANNENEEEAIDDDVASFNKQVILLPLDMVAPALWIIGDWLSIKKDPKSQFGLDIVEIDEDEKKAIASELLRLVAKRFEEMGNVLKSQALHFASKLLLSNHQVSDFQSQSSDDRALCEYILGMGRVDTDHDVRDRARYESNILHLAIGLKYDVENMTALPKNCPKITYENVKSTLLQYKPPSSWLPIEKDNAAKTEGGVCNSPFRFGTLSSMVSHKAGNAYLPLPPWATENSPSTLRDASVEKSPSLKGDQSLKKGKNGRDGKKGSSSGFYDSDEESSDDASSSDTSSYESTSSEDDSSEGDTSFEENENSSEEESSDESSSSGAQIMDQSSGVWTNPQVETRINDISSDSDSSSESDDSSFSEESDNKGHVPVEMGALGSLLEINSDRVSSKTTNAPSLVSGLEGLVMAPLVVDKGVLSGRDIESESSNWKEVVRFDLSGGLKISSRFLRGLSRDKEAKMLGMDPKNSAVICVQIKVENSRSDEKALRRVRFVNRSSCGSGIVSTTRVFVPQEIELLKYSQVCYLMLGLEFASCSDKDGAIQARFDVKSHCGSAEMMICPPLGEMLKPCDMISSDFDVAVNKLKGIHQRSVAPLSLIPDVGGTIEEKFKDLPAKIIKAANLTPINNRLSWNGNQCNFVGCLPSSQLVVFVVLECNPQTGAGEITVCCDSAMALNALLELLKKAVNT